MNRAELEHVIRAAGDIAHDDVVVVGSQAILGAFPEAPTQLLESMEADVYPLSHPERAIDVDGALGENSPFHDLFGFHAHGVGPETVVGPSGWQGRLIPVVAEAVIPAQRPRTGWCLEPHDLMLAKLAAGRDRDFEFVETALRAGLVDPAILRERVRAMPESHRELARQNLAGVIARSARA